MAEIRVTFNRGARRVLFVLPTESAKMPRAFRASGRAPRPAISSAMRLSTALALLAISTPCDAYYDASAGKPAAKPLPTYCQMGECFVQTVEAVDPVLFGSNGVLFRVESQNWQGNTNPKSLRRAADTSSFVLCSKKSPATVDQVSGREYLVTFLTPNDGGSYGHANETALSLYFLVCHARAFGDALLTDGPNFATSLGYAVRAREDQPKVDSLERVMDFAR